MAKVKDLLDANKLLARVHLEADREMKIHGIKDEELIVAGWGDAAHANRPDSNSTEGIFVGITGESLLHGDEMPVSPVMWRSGKIHNVCKSPSAAEAKALVTLEDEVNAVRFQLSEMLGWKTAGESKEETIKSVRGVIATDSKST